MRLEQPENSSTADFMKAPIKGVEMLGNRLVQDKIHIQIDIFLSGNERKILINGKHHSTYCSEEIGVFHTCSFELQEYSHRRVSVRRFEPIQKPRATSQN